MPSGSLTVAIRPNEHAYEPCLFIRTRLISRHVPLRRNQDASRLRGRRAGIDGHKKLVVVTVMLTAATGNVDKQTRTFTTMTEDLLALADWLSSLQVVEVALESTGVYWYPLYNVLEEDHTIILVNPQHMKAVPGRKTDVRDSEWIADLLRHGLLTASFIPPQPIRALRELTRYRKTLVQERSQEINRLQKRQSRQTSSWLLLRPMCWE